MIYTVSIRSQKVNNIYHIVRLMRTRRYSEVSMGQLFSFGLRGFSKDKPLLQYLDSFSTLLEAYVAASSQPPRSPRVRGHDGL